MNNSILDIPGGLRVFILAGGKSSRMGRNKARLLLGEETFVQKISRAARRLGVSVEVIDRDVVKGRGPLGGIATAMLRESCGAALFLSCDMPLVSTRALKLIASEFLSGKCRSAVFTADENRPGFPFILPAAAKSEVERLLSRNERSVAVLARQLNATLFEPPKELRSQFLNVNTPGDYDTAKTLWARDQARREKVVLNIEDLSVRRGRVELIRDFSWQVNRNEHWVIIGPNGSGKTSLLSSLLGYLTATAGDISVLGEEYGESDWPALRQKLGVVSSSVRQMMPDSEPAWITVASGKYAMIDFWGTPRPEDKREAERILRGMDCGCLADREWAVLSQGERQRVLIGRALMARPLLLILDEPCAGLDPAAREHFLLFLEKLGRGSKAPSIVLVTHHVEEIMPVFTHVLLLKDGKKVAEGPLSRTLTSKLLGQTFSNPVTLKKQGGRYLLKVAATGKANRLL